MGDDGPELLEEVEGLETVTLEEAIAILGEQTRMEIIVELGAAWDERRHQQRYLGFSELMDRVGITDSGRFNYHLEKLVDTFVTKDDEGYRLLYPGRRLYQIMVSGTLTEREMDVSFRVGTCFDCDGDIVASYRNDNVLFLQCATCERLHGAMPFSPRGFDHRTEREAFEAACRVFYTDIQLARRGICPSCDGEMRTELLDDLSDFLTAVTEGDVLASMRCRVCNDYFYADLSYVALTTPQVRQFLSNHGYDPAVVHGWDDIVLAADESETVVQTDPLRVQLTVAVDGDELDVVFDNELAVLDTSRRCRNTTDAETDM